MKTSFFIAALTLMLSFAINNVSTSFSTENILAGFTQPPGGELPPPPAIG